MEVKGKESVAGKGSRSRWGPSLRWPCSQWRRGSVLKKQKTAQEKKKKKKSDAGPIREQRDHDHEQREHNENTTLSGGSSTAAAWPTCLRCGTRIAQPVGGGREQNATRRWLSVELVRDPPTSNGRGQQPHRGGRATPGKR